MSADVISEGLYYQITVTLQAPAALNETAVAMGKGEKWQGLLSQLHFQGGSREHIDEQRIREGLCQIFIGTDAK